MKYKYLTLALFGFLGGVAGSIVFSSAASYAAKETGLGMTHFYNDAGERIGIISQNPSRDGGNMFLFEKGKTTVMMGSYPTGAEKGQSMVGLYDRQNNIRFLFRLHDKTDSPTVIMKDNKGINRIVFGLDGKTQLPYFHYSDSKGRMKNLLK